MIRPAAFPNDSHPRGAGLCAAVGNARRERQAGTACKGEK